MERAYCFTQSLVLFAAFSTNVYCASEWDEFLEHTNQGSLLLLEQSIAGAAQPCTPNVAPTQRHRTRLFELIRNGNSLAFSAALLVSECWDGGELEDFYRSAGMFFESEPLLFLKISEEKKIPDTEFRYMLTMLPLDTVDDIERRISILDRRIATLNGVDEESLSAVRSRGLSILEQRKKRLEEQRSP